MKVRRQKNGGRLASALLLFALFPAGLPQPVHAEAPAGDRGQQVNAEAPAGDRGQQLYADAFLVWIYKRPELDQAPIGYLRAGGSIHLRKEEGRALDQPARKGCGRGWFAVEPAGYVCADRRISFEPTRYTESMSSLGPRKGAFPFDYALSMGTPSYRRVPQESEWQRKERLFGPARVKPLPPHWQGHEELISDQPFTNGPVPKFLADRGSVSRAEESRLTRRDVPFGSMLAIRSAFEAHGRSFLMSSDGTVVPADRMRTFSPSTFEGVEISEKNHSLRLPLGWPRKETRAYSLKASAACAPEATPAPPPGRLSSPKPLARECLEETPQTFAPRVPLGLTGRTTVIAGTRFAETRPHPSVKETKPSSTEPSSKGSTWIPTDYLYLGQSSPPPRGTEDSNELWIHFKISEGVLVVYRGQEAEFATLASPGIGGTPQPGADPLSTRTTPVGSFRIQFKHITDDMSPEQTEERSFWIADVPYAMYFQQPFAIHVAYWHDSFGEPMSGGCINVSPKDGARLFSQTSPKLPEGWYGVGSSQEFGLGTRIVIER